jgi:hypothetical protein
VQGCVLDRCAQALTEATAIEGRPPASVPTGKPRCRGPGWRAKGCVLTAPPGSAHGRGAVAAGEVCQQPVAGKAMGLPGGRGSLLSLGGGVLVVGLGGGSHAGQVHGRHRGPDADLECPASGVSAVELRHARQRASTASLTRSDTTARNRSPADSSGRCRFNGTIISVGCSPSTPRSREVYGFLGTHKPGYSILPGFMTPVGSNARLIARITSVASPSSLSR